MMTQSEFLKNVTVLLTTYKRPAAARYMITHIQHRPLMVIVDKGREDLDVPSDLHSGIDLLACEPNCGAVKAIETGIVAIQTKYVMYLSDDMEFMDTNDAWLHELVRVYIEQLGDKDGVVASNDLWLNGAIACFPLFAKKFHMDYIYPAPYRSFCIDNEWSDKSTYLGRYAYAPAAIIRHLRWHKDYQKQLDREAAIFYKRMAEWKDNQRAKNDCI